jgi:hypothetical protein
LSSLPPPWYQYHYQNPPPSRPHSSFLVPVSYMLLLLRDDCPPSPLHTSTPFRTHQRHMLLLFRDNGFPRHAD